jgi:hypothetical protein
MVFPESKSKSIVSNRISPGAFPAFEDHKQIRHKVLKALTELARIVQCKTEHPPSEEGLTLAPQKARQPATQGVITAEEHLPNRRCIEAMVGQQMIR